MKKLYAVILVFCLVLGMVGCSSSSDQSESSTASSQESSSEASSEAAESASSETSSEASSEASSESSADSSAESSTGALTVMTTGECVLKVMDTSLYPVAEPSTELTVWCGQDGNVQNYQDNPENAALEELTGVKINWITAPGTYDDMTVAFNLNIAGGNYPDVYMHSVSTSDIIEYANDVFIPIEDYIANTRWIKEYMDAVPAIETAITAPDGHIYSLWHSLPLEGEKNNDLNQFKLWIYQPWLEQSGMDMPETIDDLTEYLIYVRDHDMNGNGDTTDEIGMMGSSAFAREGSDPTWAILQTFQVTPPDFVWADENGDYTCLAITQEYRDALTYIRNMYDQGLFAEEIYSVTLNEFRDNYMNVTSEADQIVAVAGAPYWWRLANAGIYGERLYEEFTYIPPLKKDANSPAQTYTTKNDQSVSLGVMVTTACENPQLAIDWVDACIDPEVNRVTNLGNEDEYWTRVSEEGEIPIISMSIEGKDLKDGGSQNLHTFGGWVFPGIPTTYYDTVAEEGTAAYTSTMVQKAANNAYYAVGVTDGRPAMSWCSDSDLLTEVADYETNIQSAIKTAYAEFVLGRRDINDDAEWEAYKQELEDLGLEQYLVDLKAVNFGS